MDVNFLIFCLLPFDWCPLKNYLFLKTVHYYRWSLHQGRCDTVKSVRNIVLLFSSQKFWIVLLSAGLELKSQFHFVLLGIPSAPPRDRASLFGQWRHCSPSLHLKVYVFERFHVLPSRSVCPVHTLLAAHLPLWRFHWCLSSRPKMQMHTHPRTTPLTVFSRTFSENVFD